MWLSKISFHRSMKGPKAIPKNLSQSRWSQSKRPSPLSSVTKCKMRPSFVVFCQKIKILSLSLIRSIQRIITTLWWRKHMRIWRLYCRRKRFYLKRKLCRLWLMFWRGWGFCVQMGLFIVTLSPVTYSSHKMEVRKSLILH